jgi:hypothetical protein
MPEPPGPRAVLTEPLFFEETTMKHALLRVVIAGVSLSAGGGLPLRAADTPSRTLAAEDPVCKELREKIEKVQTELVDIAQRKPPFDKMNQEDLAGNVAYRTREIQILEGKRSARGCSGAAPLGDAGSGGGSAGGPAGPGGGKPAGGPRSHADLGQALKKYAATMSGAYYRVNDECHECDLPKDTGGISGSLEVCRPSEYNRIPADGGDAGTEFFAAINVNGQKAVALSIGEDMAGYWGAEVRWARNGLIFKATVHAPYPEVKDDTPVRRKEIFDDCLQRALKAALPFDQAVK